MRIFARIEDPRLRTALEEVAGRLGAELLNGSEGSVGEEIAARRRDDLVLAEVTEQNEAELLEVLSLPRGSALVLAVRRNAQHSEALLARADEWLTLPTDQRELELRISAAQRRVSRGGRPHPAAAAQRLRYQELLYDRFTGFPTLPVMMERARELLEERGELTILYIHFVWYEKIEELYGWQKMDEVLETTAEALRSFYSQAHQRTENLIMVSHVGDDDFLLFTRILAETNSAEKRLNQVSKRLEDHLRDRIEEAHGEDMAAMCGIYVGAAPVYGNPKIRTERLIYRSLREAAQAARSVEDRERVRKVADLKATLSEGSVYMEYHPIILADTEEIYGYEALARGQRRELRSPEVLFEVAEEANMLWELSRLLRKRAVGGIADQLKEGQYLFMNIDPHDFEDPDFRDMDAAALGIEDASRVVLEITERIAIKDYPRIRDYLTAFRERGFRFAVDDAGSGYAGLGSIANLDPDYIKLDISLISNIDTNFLKQHLVRTMVEFADANDAKVVAEGVERPEEFETVREMGVHLVQGFLFHRPRRGPALEVGAD